MEDKPRSLVIFEESLKSEETRKIYTYYCQKFANYYKLRDIASIITIPPEKLQTMLEDYVIHLKKTLSPNSIPMRINGIKALLEANDIDLKWKKVKRLYPEKTKKRNERAWKKEQIRTMLKCCNDLKYAALVLFLASTGCRIGAIPELKLRHVTAMPDNCKKVTVYPDSKFEYTTFLTPEASKALDDYLQKRKNDGEYLDNNSPLFRAKYRLGIEKPRPATKKSLQEIMVRVVREAGLRNPAERRNNRYDVAVDHGFRKYFNTTLKTTPNLNRAVAERMLGHDSKDIPLDTVYFDEEISPNLVFDEFKKAIPYLTIDETAKTHAENENLKQKLSKTDHVLKLLIEHQPELMRILADYREEKIGSK